MTQDITLQVCVDGMVDRTKAEGVKALPYVGFYDGKQGKLGGSVTNPTQAKHMRRNILTVLDNPGKVRPAHASLNHS